jgi:hypothetical protein
MLLNNAHGRIWQSVTLSIGWVRRGEDAFSESGGSKSPQARWRGNKPVG